MYSRSRGDLLPTILTQRPQFIIQALLWVQATQEHNLSPEDRDAAALWPSCELIPSLPASPSPNHPMPPSPPSLHPHPVTVLTPHLHMSLSLGLFLGDILLYPSSVFFLEGVNSNPSII